MKWLSQASSAVYAVDVELFPLFLLCQMASFCLSNHCSEDNIFFQYACPRNCPISSLSQKVSPSCRMWYCRFRVFNHCDPWQGAGLPRWAPFRGGVRGAGLGVQQPGQGCHGFRCHVFILCQKAGERRGPMQILWECTMDPLAAAGALILTGALSWRCLQVGPEGQGSVSDSCLHPTAEWEPQRQSQGCALSLRHTSTLSDADWRHLGCQETASLGETMLVAQLLWSSWANRRSSAGDQAMELSSSFISKPDFSLCWCFVEALSLFGTFSFFQWVWGRSHFFS